MSEAELDLSAAHPEVLILVGTETGTAREAADEVAQTLTEIGFDAPVRDMSEVDPSVLGYVQQAICVVATHGEGDPSVGAAPFYDGLQAAPPDLSGLAFGVVALGDQTYEHFAQAGHTLRSLLIAAGAVEATPMHIVDRGLRLSQIDDVVDWAYQCAAGFARVYG
jgi:sulfite reductase (NADPH) flavoprotein alpha-component